MTSEVVVAPVDDAAAPVVATSTVLALTAAMDVLGVLALPLGLSREGPGLTWLLPGSRPPAALSQRSRKTRTLTPRVIVWTREWTHVA